MRVQIVCKKITAEKLREQLLSVFGQIDDLSINQRRGHVLVEMRQHVYRRDLLETCRRAKFAYLRLSEEEIGGSIGDYGNAVCVSGLQGEPLTPGVVRNEANGSHALFCERGGVLVATCGRYIDDWTLTLTKFEFKRYQISTRRLVQIEGHRQKFEDVLGGYPHWYEQWAPLMRATVRKASCLHCTHVHYRVTEDMEVVDGSQEVSE